MRHFAESIVFNGFNSISFRTAAKAAVARADEKPGRAEAPPISEKQYRAPAALARNCRLFVARPCPSRRQVPRFRRLAREAQSWALSDALDRNLNGRHWPRCEGQITRAPGSKLNQLPRLADRSGRERPSLTTL